MNTLEIFPFVIHNGLVAYQCAEPEISGAVTHNLPFRQWCTTAGFVLPSHGRSRDSLVNLRLAKKVEDVKTLTVITPEGIFFSLNKKSVVYQPLPLKKGTWVCSTAHAHDHYILGSLEITDDLFETAKLFRANFHTHPEPIVVEPWNIFQIKISSIQHQMIKDGKIEILPSIYSMHESL